MLRRVAMLLLRGGSRALIFVVLGVIAWVVVTKFDIPNTNSKDQWGVLRSIFAVLFVTYLILEGRRSIRLVSKTKAFKRIIKRRKGPPGPAAEALAKLQKRLASADEALKSLRADEDGDDLNTYLFIGPKGSGKTSSILHSGAGAIWLSNRGGSPKAGPTKTVDWYLCGRSVLIDTAGHYVSDDESDVQWGALLKLLKRRYRRTPITAVVVTVSLVELLHMSEGDAEGLARRIRQRLDDVVNRLGVHCPVQLLVTHTDAVEGASEFFGNAESSDREQPWGHAFTPQDHESEDLGAAFSDAFLDLIQVLERLRIDALARLSDMTARRRTFLFPAQVAACEPPLNRLVTVLTEDGLRQPPPLAGFWLTSSTQQGIVLDRIEDPLAKALGLAGRSPVRGSPGMAGQQSMFLKDFFTDILPRLGGRSSVSRAEVERQRQKTLRRYAYSGVFTVVAMLFLLSGAIGRVGELDRLDALVREVVPDRTVDGKPVTPVTPVPQSGREAAETRIKIQNGRLSALILLADRVARVGPSVQGLFSCVADTWDGKAFEDDAYETAIKLSRERHADLEDSKGKISSDVEDGLIEFLQAAIWYEQIRPSTQRLNQELNSLAGLGQALKGADSRDTLEKAQLQIYLMAVRFRNDAHMLNAWPGQVTAALKGNGGKPPDPHDLPTEEWNHKALAEVLVGVQRRALPEEARDVLGTDGAALRVTLMDLLLSRIPPASEPVRRKYKVDLGALGRVDKALAKVKPETIMYGRLLDLTPDNLRQSRAFIAPPPEGIPRSFTQQGCYDFHGRLNSEVSSSASHGLHGRTVGDDAEMVARLQKLYRTDYNRRWEEWVDLIRYGTLNDFREASEDLEGLYVAQHGGLKDLLSYIGRGPVVAEEDRPVLVVAPPPTEGESTPAEATQGLPALDVVAVCDSLSRSWNDAHQLVDEGGSKKDELSKVVGDMTELHARISAIKDAPSDVASDEAALLLMGETLSTRGPLWPAHNSARTMRLSIDNPRIAEVVRQVNDGIIQRTWELVVQNGTAAVQNDWLVVRERWITLNNRFPFDPRSAEDAKVDEVRALLGSEGELKRFVDQSMLPLLTDRGGGNYRTPDAPLESPVVPRFHADASRMIALVENVNKVVDGLDDSHRIYLTPNKYGCSSVSACNDITSMRLERDSKLEIEDFFGQRTTRDFEVTRDTLMTVTSWLGTDARRPCTARSFEGEWAFWRLMAADAFAARGDGGAEVELFFANNEPESKCSIPVRPSFSYREERSGGPAASFGVLRQLKLPEQLFRY